MLPSITASSSSTLPPTSGIVPMGMPYLIHHNNYLTQLLHEDDEDEDCSMYSEEFHSHLSKTIVSFLFNIECINLNPIIKKTAELLTAKFGTTLQQFFHIYHIVDATSENLDYLEIRDLVADQSQDMMYEIILRPLGALELSGFYGIPNGIL